MSSSRLQTVSSWAARLVEKPLTKSNSKRTNKVIFGNHKEHFEVFLKKNTSWVGRRIDLERVGAHEYDYRALKLQILK